MLTNFISQKILRYLKWGLLIDALYLPDVFLENTYNNGQWIKPNDTSWKKGNQIHSAQTLRRLERKANVTRKNVKKKLNILRDFLLLLFIKNIIYLYSIKIDMFKTTPLGARNDGAVALFGKERSAQAREAEGAGAAVAGASTAPANAVADAAGVRGLEGAVRSEAALDDAAARPGRPSGVAAKRARRGGWLAAAQAQVDEQGAEKSDPKVGEQIRVEGLDRPQTVVDTRWWPTGVEHVLSDKVDGTRSMMILRRSGSPHPNRRAGRQWIYNSSRPGELGRGGLLRRMDAAAAMRFRTGGGKARRSSTRRSSTRKRRRGPVRRRTARKKTRQRKPKRTLSKRKKSRGTRRRNR